VFSRPKASSHKPAWGSAPGGQWYHPASAEGATQQFADETRFQRWFWPAEHLGRCPQADMGRAVSAKEVNLKSLSGNQESIFPEKKYFLLSWIPD
jgi:hypothetical protein